MYSPTNRLNRRSKGFAPLVTTLLLLIFHGLCGAFDATQAQTKAYITEPCSGVVLVIDTATNTVTTVIDIGTDSGPLAVAITPDALRAYITLNFPDSFRGGLSVIDTATNTEVGAISSDDPNGVGVRTTAVAITPDGTRAYVGSEAGIVSVIDTATITVIASLNVGNVPPFGVAITPDSTRAYIVNRTNSTVSVVNTATNMVIATIPLPAGSSPQAIAITPNGRQAYVANSSNSTVFVIDTATNTSTGTIQVGLAPTGLAISPDGTKLFVTNRDSSSVSVINTATNAVIATIQTATGSSPTGIALTPDGSRAYVVTSHPFTSTISVIDTATNTVVATLPFFSCGIGAIAITPVPQVPTSVDQCKNDGYKRFGAPAGPFANQGQCVSFVRGN